MLHSCLRFWSPVSKIQKLTSAEHQKKFHPYQQGSLGSIQMNANTLAKTLGQSDCRKTTSENQKIDCLINNTSTTL